MIGDGHAAAASALGGHSSHAASISSRLSSRPLRQKNPPGLSVSRPPFRALRRFLADRIDGAR